MAERLYFFSLAILSSAVFSAIISFLIAFKIKTKRTEVFALFIVLVFPLLIRCPYGGVTTYQFLALSICLAWVDIFFNDEKPSGG